MKRIVEKTADPLSALVGVSYGLLLFSWLSLTLVFGLVYYVLAEIPGHGPSLGGFTPIERLLDAIYFSIIVGTTTGLGDIVPHGFSKVFTAIQAIVSFILLAAFVAKFASKQQDIVIDDIHKISFDSSFHTIRNGLFISRKDIDVLMQKAMTDTPLLKKDWLNLKTAVRQMQIFIKHIPDFYRKTGTTYNFDTDREMLLIDSLDRTLTRLVEALNVFTERGIDLKGEPGVVKELDSLLSNIETMSLQEEKKTFDPENHEAFQEVLNRTEEVRQHVRSLS